MPIIATFTSCEVSSVGFAKASISFQYQIGSGTKRVALPALTQKPACNFPIEGLQIVSVTAEVATDKVLSALQIDFPQMSLLIDTGDVATFGGKQVSLEVMPVQNLVDQARKLIIKIDFQSEKALSDEITAKNEDEKHQFGLDYTQLVVPALTCTKADRNWLIQLPEVVNDGLDSFDFQFSLQN